MRWHEHTAVFSSGGVRATVLRAAFVIELYADATLLPHGGALFDALWALVPKDGAAFFINTNGRSYQALTKAALTRLRRSLDSLVDEGQHYELKDAPDFHIDAWALELLMSWHGCSVHVALPLSWLEAVGPDGAWRAVCDVVDRFPIAAATAGFGFAQPRPRECEMKSMPANLRAALLHPGLMVRNRGQEQRLDGAGQLKSVHWLTYVGQKALAKLGGVEAARDLGAGVGVHEAGGGLLLRAGPRPVADPSDVDGAAGIDALRAVDAFVRPVRLAEFIHGTTNLFMAEEPQANAWLRRFET
jgi:hypothetical protein